MRMKRLVLAIVAALPAACASSGPSAETAAPAPIPGRARLEPCKVEGVAEELLCGTYPVWENRTTRQGRKIDIGIVVIPAKAAHPAPDPLFLFAGGPGDAASNGAAGMDPALRARRDIVMVDQRGTGRSHRLTCQVPSDPTNVQGYFEPSLPVDAVRTCRAELEKDADLTQYTTSIGMDDIDEVRQWLGYDKINLFGGSYGTRAVQVYMRRHGDHVRSAVIAGTTAMHQHLPLYHARDGKKALDLLFGECAADPACAAAFPDLAAEHERVLARLDRERGRATVKSPFDGKQVAVTIPRDIFAEQIRFTMYNAATAAATPYVVHRAAQGDFGPFARLALLWEPAFRRILAWGMHLSVTCAEDVPFMTPATIEEAIAGTYLRGYRVLQQVAACGVWARGAIPDDFHRPVVTDIPTLVLSGPFDPVTPPRWAEEVVPHLSRGKHVIIPDGHHGPGGLAHPECFSTMIEAFLERGSAEGLDTSCVDGMKRPPFLTDHAAFDALLKAAGG
jgi:pimeloyl-ACP methyl ester carboxylesterase